ncbi:MAG: NAD(P)H-binding protein [Pseudomonadota bacterium]
MARILVTTATGRVGSALLPRLTAAGHSVVAVTRREQTAARLREQSIEPIVADLKQPASLQAAMDGVDAVFLATPDDPEQDSMEAALIAMIAESGKPHVVKLSAQSAGLDPPVSFGIHHRRSELALEQSGLPYTILRPTFFQQSLLLFADDVAKKRRITAPVGSGKIAMVNIEDIAGTAAAVLGNDVHYGKTYTLTGPSAHGFDEVVGHLSGMLDAPVGHTSPPALAARLLMPFLTGMPRWQTSLVVDLMTALRDGAQENVTSDIEDVTGSAPIALEDFLASNISAFRH